MRPDTTSGKARADGGMRLLRSVAFSAACTAVSAPAHAGTRRRTDEETGRGETPLLDHAVVRRGPPVPATP
jgi:hypothetical protein